MNIIASSFSRLRGLTLLSSIPRGECAAAQQRSFSSCIVAGGTARPPAYRSSGPLSTHAEGSGVFQQLPWQYQQIRTGKRGMEYQPKNIKRKRTHGWIKRISSRGGIEVILRRMLKGRKSLTH